MRTLAALILSFTLTSCASTVLVYRQYGEFDPAEQTRVREAWNNKETAVGAAAVMVYQQSFPEGIHYNDGALEIDKGAPYGAVGEFTLNFAERLVLPSDEEAVAEMKRLAALAGGQVVVCALQYKDPNHPYVYKAVGFIIKRTDG